MRSPASTWSCGCGARLSALLHLLVWISAPQALLADPAAEILAGECAPHSVAGFELSEHAGLQSCDDVPRWYPRSHKAEPDRPSKSAPPPRCACLTTMSGRPSLPPPPSRGCAASSRIRRSPRPACRRGYRPSVPPGPCSDPMRTLTRSDLRLTKRGTGKPLAEPAFARPPGRRPAAWPNIATANAAQPSRQTWGPKLCVVTAIW